VFHGLTITEDTHLKAVFKPLHKLTTASAAGGVVERSPNAVRYPEGDSVTLTPRANPGWRFHHWEGDLTGDNTPATITMSADKTVIPVFVPNITMHVDITDDGKLVQ
jgi:hypothetical protein